MTMSGGTRGSLAILLLVEGYAVPQGMRTTSLLTVSLLFLSREEESQKESPHFPTPVVSPGLGNYRETD